MFFETALWQNVKELMVRTLNIFLCFVLSFLVALEYTEEIIIVISKYFLKNSTNNYQIFFSYTNLLDGSNIIYDLAGYCSLLITWPFILIQAYSFAKPGLYKFERNFLLKIIIKSIVFHSFFIYWYFFSLLPFILYNLNELNEEFDFTRINISLETNLTEYIELVKKLFIFNYFFILSFTIILIYSISIIIFTTGRLTFYLSISGALISILYYYGRLDLSIISFEFFLNFCLIQEFNNLKYIMNKTKSILLQIRGRSRIRTYARF